MGRNAHTDEEELDEQNQCSPKSIVVHRLEEADIHLERFIDVRDGSKIAYDHTKKFPDSVEENYGVYTGKGLLALDVDGFETDTSRINEFPDTFTVSTANGGEHRYFRVNRRAVSVVTAATNGSRSPSFDWGELYTSKYLVGPGSEIDGSDTKWHKGRYPKTYGIAANRPIATLSDREIAALFQSASTDFGGGQRQGSILEFSDAELPPARLAEPERSLSEEQNNPPSFQQKLDAPWTAAAEELVWTVLQELSEANDGEGAKIEEVLDKCEAMGLGRFRASETLMGWLDKDDIRKFEADNRIVPRERRSQ